MRDLAANDPLIEDLAMLIDEALENPARAASVKARIKARLGRPEAEPAATRDTADADVEDFWDNVPL